VLRAAVIGLGWWGRTIVRTLEGSERLQVVAGVDPAPGAAEAGLRLLPSLEAALAEDGVQVVILCTPHSQHAAQVVQAAAAGKHVFCEKPLCLTLADAERAVAACRDAGVVLGVGHERRFEPPVLELRRLLAEGALGVPLQIEANFSQDKFLGLAADNWRVSAQEAPAGPLTATGIHLLDLCVSLLGPAESALARVRRLGSDLANGDTLGALIGFRSGASALISAILATPFDGRFAVYGSGGWAEVRDKAHPEAPEGWTLTVARRARERQVTEYAPASGVRANLEAFADAADGRAAYPMPDAEKIGTVAALEAVVRSAGSGRVERVRVSPIRDR
jgi:predicted dehydrogenase